jgi:hypothetical protein
MTFAVLHCTPPASPSTEDKGLAAQPKCLRWPGFPFDGNTYPSQKQAPKNVTPECFLSLDFGEKVASNWELLQKNTNVAEAKTQRNARRMRVFQPRRSLGFNP